MEMKIFEFRQIFKTFENNSTKIYKDIFEKLKIFLKTRLGEYLDSIKRNNRGRKRTVDLERVLTCLFFIADNGMKMSYIKEYFGMSRST